MRTHLTFLRNGKKTTLSDFHPETTLLEYLRLSERKTGTKEGCNEGDCGACTVALGKLRDGELSYEPVNACILLLGQVDGCDIITVDDLAVGGSLHPVQQAMVDHHGSQCGFCTPGIVMSLFTLHHSGQEASRPSINDYLSGNLCRCTGYRPIVDAAQSACSSKPDDALARRFGATAKKLAKLADGNDLMVGSKEQFFAAPATKKSLAVFCAKFPHAQIVSGATDVGLWITKQGRKLPQIIYTGRAAGLQKISESKSKLVIGAGVTYRDGYRALSRLHCDVAEVLRRLGSRHVRASGTIGGNIANGSPIGDMPPMLIAMGASLELQLGKKVRSLPLEKFFIEYGKQDRQAGELVTKVIIPKLKKKQHFRAFKLSKRFDQDISAVLFACVITVQKGRIVSAKIACGGMAGTPARAKHVEVALVGAKLSEPGSWERAIAAFEKDYTPLSDMRASSEYRMKIVQNLLIKALTEINQGELESKATPTRLEAVGEVA